MSSPVISVTHRLGTYNIRFDSLETARAGLPSPAFVLTDDHVSAAWSNRFNSEWQVMSVRPGESSKSLQTFGECLSWLAQSGTDRLTPLIAFGGGVVGDLGGFVAAAYMRGIPYVQVPTSLLAQVDSSVGGKVAIDLPEGKNLAGAFYPPNEVWVCPELLSTLPEREFRNGLAEVWKYGFIMDRDLANRVEQVRLRADSPELTEIVEACIRHKARIVQEDELDTTGQRAILNFGHTVGHALELLHGYKDLLHGEAVAIGMVAEARLGERLGITAPGTAAEIEACLALDGLPTTSDMLRDPRMWEAMLRDKKTEGGELAFSLLTEIGECKLVRNVPRREVEAVLSAL